MALHQEEGGSQDPHLPWTCPRPALGQGPPSRGSALRRGLSPGPAAALRVLGAGGRARPRQAAPRRHGTTTTTESSAACSSHY